MASLSVVVPSLNSIETIHRNLSSLLMNDFPRQNFEIIVADGGGTDGTPEIASKFPVKVYLCSRKGIGAGRNLGIAKAKYDTICFVDSDCVVPPNYLRKISDYFDAHPEVDGIGGPVLPYIDKGTNDWSRFIEEIYCEACAFPKEVTVIGPREEVWTKTLKGPNFSFRKRALICVNGFEENMPGEDIDLCWRLVENGKSLRFIPDIKVYHYIRGDLRRIFRHSFKWGVDCMALRKKYPENPLTLLSESRNRRPRNDQSIIRWESLIATISVLAILRSIISFRPLYNDRKKAFLRAYMLAAFYLGYFHAPKHLMQYNNLGSF